MEKNARQWLQALSYVLWPVGLVALLVDDKDKNLRYHGAQGLTFGLLCWVVIWLLGMLFLWRVVFLLSLVEVAWLVLAIFYAMKAYRSEQFKVPIVHDIMRKFQKG